MILNSKKSFLPKKFSSLSWPLQINSKGYISCHIKIGSSISHLNAVKQSKILDTESTEDEDSSHLSSAYNNPYTPQMKLSPWRFISPLIVFGLVIRLLNGWPMITGSLDVEEYTTNEILVEAQHNAKVAKARGEAPISRLDEFMASTPDFKSEKGYRIYTPGGHYALYYENENGEPFLLDDADNLWIWAGADINNPIDDWLVRTSEGNVYNYFMNEKGQLQQKLLGNEKDLKVLSNTNLGTILGFVNDEIRNLHYWELPLDSLETYKDPKSNKEILLPPPILEEGFVDLRRKNNLFNNIFPSRKNERLDDNREIEKLFRNGEKFQIDSDPFLDSINVDEEKMIDVLKIKGRISPSEAQKLKSELVDEIKEEAKTTLEGLDINNLPSALVYTDAGKESTRQD